MKRLAALAVLLTGCGSEADPPGVVTGASAENRIECAVGGETFERACLVSRDGERLTVKHPDGGFRRLLLTADGRGVAAADGAEAAEVAVIGPNRIEVTVGSDRYRLPATVKCAS